MLTGQQPQWIPPSMLSEEEDGEQQGLFLVEFTAGDPQAEEVGEEVLLSTIFVSVIV